MTTEIAITMLLVATPQIMQSRDSRGIVQVCLRDMVGVPIETQLHARALASRMFHRIGVMLDWSCKPRTHSSTRPTILIKLAASAPGHLSSEALAYAQAFGGRHITIFYNRLRQTADRPQIPFLLGHVLVHEVTHTLLHNDKHSDIGLMKRLWNRDDIRQMQGNLLPFAPEDALQIQAVLGIIDVMPAR
jgi:hypothetical protein